MNNFLYVNKEVYRNHPLVYYINRAGSGRVPAEFNIQRNKAYPYCVIHCLTGGAGSVFYRNKKYRVGKGQLFILNAFEPHQYTTDPENPFEFNWIEFCGGDSIRIIREILDRQSPIVDGQCCARINHYLLKIFSLLQNGRENKSVLLSKAIYSILLTLLNGSENARVNEIPEGRMESIRKAIQYIENNLNENLDIEQLSKISNFTPTYFAKIFHKITGATPARFVSEKRVSKAKELLSFSHLPIENLSEELGFCNASHFIRIFKKAEGLTPAEYRRQSILFRQGKA